MYQEPILSQSSMSPGAGTGSEGAQLGGGAHLVAVAQCPQLVLVTEERRAQGTLPRPEATSAFRWEPQFKEETGQLKPLQ